MGKIKNYTEVKLNIEQVNNAYKIIRTYLLTCEMLNTKGINDNDLDTYRYLKSVLKKYKKTWQKSKLFYQINLTEKDDLIL